MPKSMMSPPCGARPRLDLVDLREHVGRQAADAVELVAHLARYHQKGSGRKPNLADHRKPSRLIFYQNIHRGHTPPSRRAARSGCRRHARPGSRGPRGWRPRADRPPTPGCGGSSAWPWPPSSALRWQRRGAAAARRDAVPRTGCWQPRPGRDRPPGRRSPGGARVPHLRLRRPLPVGAGRCSARRLPRRRRARPAGDGPQLPVVVLVASRRPQLVDFGWRRPAMLPWRHGARSQDCG